MDDFLKMDIFFLIATLAVVVIAVLIAIVLVYLIRLVRTLDRISSEVEEEAKALRADIDEVRGRVKAEGIRLKHLLGIAKKTGKRLLAKDRRTTKP